jgi:hypothetical protein
MSRGRWAFQTCLLTTSLLAVTGEAGAQVAPQARRALLPAVPELRLNWPIKPQSFSYTESERLGYGSAPLQLFRAESLWLAAPGFRLLSFTSSELAFELDCTLTCQPTTMRGLGLEARFLLPDRVPLVSQPHVYVRPASMRTAVSPRSVRSLQVGLGGFLNF